MSWAFVPNLFLKFFATEGTKGTEVKAKVRFTFSVASVSSVANIFLLIGAIFDQVINN